MEEIPGSTDTMADVMEIAPIVRRTMDIAMAAGIMGTITHTAVSSEETNAAGAYESDVLNSAVFMAFKRSAVVCYR